VPTLIKLLWQFDLCGGFLSTGGLDLDCIAFGGACWCGEKGAKFNG